MPTSIPPIAFSAPTPQPPVVSPYTPPPGYEPAPAPQAALNIPATRVQPSTQPSSDAATEAALAALLEGKNGRFSPPEGSLY